MYSLSLNHLRSYGTPVNIHTGWSFGALVGICLMVQILTGIILSMYYTPHIDFAYESVQYIMRDVKNGWFIRYTHSNGASMFFATLYLHIGRSIYYKSYLPPRELVWYSGFILLLLSMAVAFMGYVLPWGQMSYWGAVVITNVFTAIPYVGNSMAKWIWGGYGIANPTLNRFFSLHYLLPFIICGLITSHLFLLHLSGSSNPLKTYESVDKVSFYQPFYIKDFTGLWILAIVWVYFVHFDPNYFSNPDIRVRVDYLMTPRHIVPEWYFLPFYAILRIVPNKVGGVLCMFSAIGLIAILPLIDNTINRLICLWSIYNYCFIIWVCSFATLMWAGAKPMGYPYDNIAIGATILYFSIPLYVFPILSRIVNKFEIK